LACEGFEMLYLGFIYALLGLYLMVFVFGAEISCLCLFYVAKLGFWSASFINLLKLN